MPFASGTVSFRRFRIVGTLSVVNAELLDVIKANGAPSFDECGTPVEIRYWWCGRRHLLDASYSFGNMVFDGSLLLSMRVDTNKVPAAIAKAMLEVEKQALAKGNPSGMISKAQIAEAKKNVRKLLEDELKTGKYIRSKLIPVFINPLRGIVYANVQGKAREALFELFEDTFGAGLSSVTAGTVAADMKTGIEELRPMDPDAPWLSDAMNRFDFLGSEFLLWLWWQYATEGGNIGTSSLRYHNVQFMLDQRIDVASGTDTGRDSFISTGPGQLPEAIKAVAEGKRPRRMGLTLAALGSQYSLILGADLDVSGCKLPDIEDTEDERQAVEQRLEHVRDLCQIIEVLYGEFLTARTAATWEGTAEAMLGAFTERELVEN